MAWVPTAEGRPGARLGYRLGGHERVAGGKAEGVASSVDNSRADMHCLTGDGMGPECGGKSKTPSPTGLCPAQPWDYLDI